MGVVRAEVQKILGGKLIATGPEGLVSFHWRRITVCVIRIFHIEMFMAVLSDGQSALLASFVRVKSMPAARRLRKLALNWL